MINNIAISFKNVSKSYPQYHYVTSGIKHFLVNFPNSLKSYFLRFEALGNINFDIYKGECFGFIGRNGAGKSTALGLIAGVLKPDSGTVTVNGRISPLLELGAGFSPELTGIENIVLNGVLLGLTKREVLEQLDSIIDFSELKDFIHQPIRTYSSGMYAKLGFSVIANLAPEILLIDEVLAVGDIEFVDKCIDRLEIFRASPDVTMVVVSHNMDDIKRLCDRAAWIEDRSLRMIGPAEEVASAYERIEKKGFAIKENIENPISYLVLDKQAINLISGQTNCFISNYPYRNCKTEIAICLYDSNAIFLKNIKKVVLPENTDHKLFFNKVDSKTISCVIDDFIELSISHACLSDERPCYLIFKSTTAELRVPLFLTEQQKEWQEEFNGSKLQLNTTVPFACQELKGTVHFLAGGHAALDEIKQTLFNCFSYANQAGSFCKLYTAMPEYILSGTSFAPPQLLQVTKDNDILVILASADLSDVDHNIFSQVLSHPLKKIVLLIGLANSVKLLHERLFRYADAIIVENPITLKNLKQKMPEGVIIIKKPNNISLEIVFWRALKEISNRARRIDNK